jgi:NAD(P)-dependent dehydrogenase (short-subunit alcohol dehydrogenase family)
MSCVQELAQRTFLAIVRFFHRGGAGMQDLAGKTAFVTGAASGIGRGIATALAQAGMKVMLCDIEAAPLAAAVEALRLTNADVEAVQADVSLKTELAAAAKATLERFGKVHVLVSNAGVGGGGRYGKGWSDAGWDWMIGVNLMAAIWAVELFGPLIERHGEGGQIVFTASAAGLFSGSSSPYSVTKYGVVALSEGLRVELAPRGIGVSVLCPGLVNTNIADSVRNLPSRFAARAEAWPAGATAAQLQQMRELLATGHDPVDVGDLVREAIEGDWPYIFTDLQFEPAIDARFANIKAGFDRTRGRVPPRHG